MELHARLRGERGDDEEETEEGEEEGEVDEEDDDDDEELSSDGNWAFFSLFLCVSLEVLLERFVFRLVSFPHLSPPFLSFVLYSVLSTLFLSVSVCVCPPSLPISLFGVSPPAGRRGVLSVGEGASLRSVAPPSRRGGDRWHRHRRES